MQKSVMYFWKDQVLLIGEPIETCEHQHYAIQISIDLSRMCESQESKQWQTYSALIIAPNYPHQIGGLGSFQATLLIEPDTKLGQLIVSQYLKESSIREINLSLLEKQLVEFKKYLTKKKSCCVARKFSEYLLQQLLGSPSLPKGLDSRIQQALKLIKESHSLDVTSGFIAHQLDLSESRFTHLFKDELNIPLRRYLLWLRLIKATRLLLSEHSFTSVAHEVGFSDGAHLSRTFKKMFGLTPTEVFKNSENVQAISCLK